MLSYKKQQLLEKFNQIDLYVVTCEKLSAGRSNLEVLDGIIAGGGKIVQLRDKDLSISEYFTLAKKFREVTKKAGVLLIINDYVDIAVAVGADGVHLGQSDMNMAFARQMALDLIIGRSIHSLEQALEAQNFGADYINIGPIFPTQTKENVVALGTDIVKEISAEIKIPFTVMGGIKKENMPQLFDAGAYKIAMVTEITQAPDISVAVRDLSKMIQAAKPIDEDGTDCGSCSS